MRLTKLLSTIPKIKGKRESIYVLLLFFFFKIKKRERSIKIVNERITMTMQIKENKIVVLVCVRIYAVI